MDRPRRFRMPAWPVWLVVTYFGAVVGLLLLAPVLPKRGELAADAVAGLAGGLWCGANFLRCRQAHCLVTGVGWPAVALLAGAEAVLGRSIIHGDEQVVLVVLLLIGVALELGLLARHGTNALPQVSRRRRRP